MLSTLVVLFSLFLFKYILSDKTELTLKLISTAHPENHLTLPIFTILAEEPFTKQHYFDYITDRKG